MLHIKLQSRLDLEKLVVKTLCVWPEILILTQMVEGLMVFGGHIQTWLFLYRDFESHHLSATELGALKKGAGGPESVRGNK